MYRTLIALLTAVILAAGLAPIPLAAQEPPTCQNGTDSDPDGDGWGWENDRSCVVVEDEAPEPEPDEQEPPSSPEPTSPAPAPQEPADAGCDYSAADANGGWGWNDTTGTSCPPQSDSDGGAPNNDQPDPTSNPDPNSDPEPTSDPDPNSDPDLAAVRVTATATSNTVTLSWTDWVANNPTSVDGYRIVRDRSFLGTGVTTGTSYTDTGIGIIGFGNRLSSGTTYTFEVSAYKIVGDNSLQRNYGPATTITVTTTEADAPAPVPSAVTNLVAVRSENADGSVSFSVAWVAPTGWETSVDGYWVDRNGGDQIILNQPGRSSTKITDPTETTFEDGPYAPGDWGYDQLVAAPPTYEVRAFNSESVSGPTVTTTTIVFSDVPSTVTPSEPRHPAFAEAIFTILPTADAARQEELADLFWKADYRARNGINSHPSQVTELRDLLLAEGFDPGIDQWTYALTAQSDINRHNQTMVTNTALAAAHRSLTATIPGFAIHGGTKRGVVEARLGTFGGTPHSRADRFFANQPKLTELLDALPDQPNSASQVEEIEILAFEQAELLLNIRPSSRRHLWEVLREVNEGIHPTTRVETSDDSSMVPAPTAFSNLWNGSSKDDRLRYYGIDPVGWALAEPYIELSLQMDEIQDDLENWLKPLVHLIIGGAIAYVTSGLAAEAYAAYFGVSASSFGAVAFGGAVGSYASAFYLTGSTSQAEKAAWGSLLNSGLAHYTRIPVQQRTTSQIFAIAMMEGGVAALEGGSFKDALIASLAKHYIPGAAAFVQGLDEASPFLRDLGELLLRSYIENEGDWRKIADDFERYLLAEAGDLVGNFVGDQLDAQWGTVGRSIGTLAGVAVASGGDENIIRQAVARELGSLVNQGVGHLLGDQDSWVADFTGELTSIYIRAQGVPEDQRAQFIDDQVSAYVFKLAADSISSNARDAMVQANGGQTNGLIEAATKLLRVAVFSLRLGQDGFEQAVEAHLANELRTTLSSVFPDCAPDWINALGDTMIGTVLNAAATGNTDAINARLTVVVNQTIASGRYEEGVGTCHLTESGGSSGGSGGSSASGSAGGGQTGPVCADDGAATCTTNAEFRAWLVELSPDAIGDSTSRESADSGQVIITSEAAPDLRLILEGDSGRFQRYVENPNELLSWQADGTPGLRVLFDEQTIVSFVDPFFGNFKQWLVGLNQVDAPRIVDFSPAPGNGGQVDIGTPRFDDEHRLEVVDGLGLIFVATATGGWAATNDAVLVERDGNGNATRFTNPTDADAANISRVLQGLVTGMIGVPTTSAEWQLLWQEVRGCASAISAAASDLLYVILNPIDSLVELIDALPALLAALQYDPMLFLEEQLKDILHSDDYNAATTDAERRELIGRVKCELVLSLVGGRALDLLTPDDVATLRMRANRGDYDRYGDGGSENTGPDIGHNGGPALDVGPRYRGVLTELDPNVGPVRNIRYIGDGISSITTRAVPITGLLGDAWRFEFEISGTVQRGIERSGFEVDLTPISSHNAAPNIEPIWLRRTAWVMRSTSRCTLRTTSTPAL